MADFRSRLISARNWWRDETLARLAATRVAAGARSRRDRRAGETLTYGQLGERVRNLRGRRLRKPASAAATSSSFICRTFPNSSSAGWRSIELGAVMQTVHTPYGPRELEHLLQPQRRQGLHRAWRGPRIAHRREKSQALRGKCRRLKFVIAVGGEVPGTNRFRDLMDADLRRSFAPPADRRQRPFPAALHLRHDVVAESGFGHLQSLSQQRAHVRGRIRHHGRRSHPLPRALYAPVWTLRVASSASRSERLPACSTSSLRPDLSRRLSDSKPTMLFAGPAHVAPCLQQQMFDGVDFSRAARRSPVRVDRTRRPCRRRSKTCLPNGKVLQAWGMTELQFGACSRPSDSARYPLQNDRPGNPRHRIACRRRRRIASCRAAKSASCTCAAARCSPAMSETTRPTRRAFTADGWLRTGDLARMDAQGNVQLDGRTKELINRGGIKFNPIDMEIAISSHPSVAQVAIAPIPDDSVWASGHRASSC